MLKLPKFKKSDSDKSKDKDKEKDNEKPEIDMSKLKPETATKLKASMETVKELEKLETNINKLGSTISNGIVPLFAVFTEHILNTNRELDAFFEKYIEYKKRTDDNFKDESEEGDENSEEKENNDEDAEAPL